MAYFAPLTHIFFTSHIKTLVSIKKDVQARRTDSCSLLSSSSTYFNGTLCLASKSWGEELHSMKRHHNTAVAHSRHYFGAIYLDYSIVCTPRVISGFWVGPDIEDGWGFVEATKLQRLVNRYNHQAVSKIVLSCQPFCQDLVTCRPTKKSV